MSTEKKEIFNQDDHEVFIVMAQEQEFSNTKLWIQSYSMSMYGMLKDAFRQYEPLRRMAAQALKDLEAEELDKKEPKQE